MPKVRHRIGFHDSAFSSDGSSSRKPTNGVRDPLSLFPDVLLNPQHRYCTPPPLDPSLIERDDVEVGFPPSTLSRNPSVSEHLALFEEPPPPPPVGSQDDPILLDDEGDGALRRGILSNHQQSHSEWLHSKHVLTTQTGGLQGPH
ncbi:hypothetical protein DICSQDRAFT_166855 [Dichomitus squalens LYAD-421 SS1]|uniref:uncharacterized protein n=1 Tax=Dichomitus squalens (strain LYAD-421) TaxID=732165 RepID=UPI0004415B69|nr:uncharacterized protein DICSQDRAFT_166855 [Dichomitus squalens LYAD-421 SS1]EJF64693.1 hypothetical protein DICSQDRAFT_166855 [Dichomitus squalens LYAD-421 SS1]